MENQKPISFDETRQSIESTQKNAIDIGERVKEVAYMSDKINHDRMIMEILNDSRLTLGEKMKMYDHEQKQYQYRQKANVKRNGRMQDQQTKNTILSTIGWCVVSFCIGGTVGVFCPLNRENVTNSIKQIEKVGIAE